MRTTTRFAFILLSIACVSCGSNTADETTDMDPVGNGSNGDSNGGATMSTNGATGASGTGATGATGATAGDDDAGTPGPVMPPAITGMEPECVAAFTRVSQCYLSQAKCTMTAKDSAPTLGAALSTTNCAMLAMQAGGLPALAAQWNAQTACDAASITGVFPSLDMNKQIKGLCESAPLTAAECTTSCANIVPCAAGIQEPMAMMALGDKMNCEGNCNMQPTLATIFRCGIMAGNVCTAVQACFMP